MPETIDTLLEYANYEELLILLNLAKSIVEQGTSTEPAVLPT